MDGREIDQAPGDEFYVEDDILGGTHWEGGTFLYLCIYIYFLN